MGKKMRRNISIFLIRLKISTAFPQGFYWHFGPLKPISARFRAIIIRAMLWSPWPMIAGDQSYFGRKSLPH